MPKKILIIEDEEALIDIYSLRFEKDGYQVITASNGKEGIELAKKEQPNLILLDVIMPEMDGYTVLKKLKADPKTKKLRVVFLSNLGQDDEIKQGLKMGAEDYIIKSSLTPSSLVKRVKKFLGSSNSVSNNLKVIQAVGETKSPLGKPSCLGMKVLLIEDNLMIIDMYKMRLEEEGAEVTTARNGAWGIKQAKSGNFDVILMDMVMPALNGLEAIKSLKKDPRTAKIPIIVFSNSAQDKDIVAAKKVGAVNYFVKSNITPAILVQEVKKYCKK